MLIPLTAGFKALATFKTFTVYAFLVYGNMGTGEVTVDVAPFDITVDIAVDNPRVIADNKLRPNGETDFVASIRLEPH